MWQNHLVKVKEILKVFLATKKLLKFTDGSESKTFVYEF
jgi:hypothetical protein